MARRRRHGLLNNLLERTAYLRFAAIGVVLMFLALMIWHSVSRASGPFQATVNHSYAKLVAAEVEQSNLQGVKLIRLLKTAPDLDRATLQSRLDNLASACDVIAARTASYNKPRPSNASGDSVAKVMDLRADATHHVVVAMEGILGLGPKDPVGTPTTAASAQIAILPISSVEKALVAAGSEIQRSDALWPQAQAQLARGDGHAKLPRSAWITDPQLIAPGPMHALAENLASSASLSPIHRVSLASISLVPGPLPHQGGPGGSYLVPTDSIRVSAFLANSGNVDEPTITITYTLDCLDDATSVTTSVSKPISLGISKAITPVIFKTKPDHHYHLTVTVTPPSGQTNQSDLTQVADLTIAPDTPKKK
ncbi:MAG: hypothetical protein WCO31_00295 [Actinomycetes bacterium]